MSVPSPQSPLDGRCTAIDQGTLYVLSSTAFQSLPLKENATWSTLDQGQAVTNPACVRIAPGGDDSKALLYVIGGSTQDSSFSGIQSYTFSTKQWQTISPPTPDMVGRVDHSVAYLPSANSILVYAGSQPAAESKYSSQTFVISLTAPNTIRSFESTAPPGNQPILMTFDENSAILIGSNTRDKEIWQFNANSGWNKFSTELSDPIEPSVQGLLLDGADGSKVLTTYDATKAPNAVKQIVLLDAGGQPAKSGETIGGGKKRKRDLTLSNWPKYNSSAAPSIVRSDYTVTQDAAGLAVLTGGSTDSPVNMFDNVKNAWVDNGLFFSGKANDNQVPIGTTSTSSRPSSTSVAPTSSATSTDLPLLPGSSSRPRMLKILGITLGTLCGLAALFILALLILRWRRQKKRKQGGYVNEKGDRMDFQDRGAPHMREAGGSNIDVSHIPPNHRFTQHNSSHNSFAIMAGKFNNRNLAAPANGRGSSESMRQLVKPRKNDIRGPVELDMWGRDKEVFAPNCATSATGAPQIPASALTGAREDNLLSSFVEGKKRSSGWSRYFAGGDPQLPSAYDRGPTTSGYTATTDYTNTSRPTMPSRIPSSALVPPLDLEYTKAGDGQRISAVVTGSPSFNNSAEDLARRGSSIEAARGQAARLHTPRDHMTPSRGHDTLASEDDDRALSMTGSTRSYATESTDYGVDYSRGGYGAGDTSALSNWTPVSNAPYDVKPIAAAHARGVDSANGSPEMGRDGEGFSSGNVRAPSSNYTASYYGGPESRVMSARGNTGFWPSNKESALRPSSRGGLRSSEVGGFPMPPTMPGGEEGERDSTVTVFPRGVNSGYYAGREEARKQEAVMKGGNGRTDMSWLNLGLK